MGKKDMSYAVNNLCQPYRQIECQGTSCQSNTNSMQSGYEVLFCTEGCAAMLKCFRSGALSMTGLPHKALAMVPETEKLHMLKHYSNVL